MSAYEVLVTGYASVFVDDAETAREAGMLAVQTLDMGAMMPVNVEAEELSCPDRIEKAREGADLRLFAPPLEIEETKKTCFES